MYIYIHIIYQINSILSYSIYNKNELIKVELIKVELIKVEI